MTMKNSKATDPGHRLRVDDDMPFERKTLHFSAKFTTISSHSGLFREIDHNSFELL